MKIWYTCKAKFNKEDDEGILKQVTEAYLLDAMSYTEAESRIYEVLEKEISGEFHVNTITKTNITEVIPNEQAEIWFKCKAVYTTVDGDSAKEVKINMYFLVSANDVKEAFEMVTQSLSGMLVPFEIPSIAKTSIVEVYPFIEEGDEDIPDNLTPLSELE
ncbi:MAG: DUF4494 domain-containing protein [Cyclobacteriaceae bacterium]